MSRAPHTRSKASARIRTPDEMWAADIARRILQDCHPWQMQGVVDPARRISFLVGRGGAKTTTMRARAVIKIITLRGQTVGYAATSADQARILNWEKLKDTCEAYGIRSATTNIVSKEPDVSFLDAKMVMRCLRTGSVYQLRGVEDRRDAEKFRGYGQAEFQVDECGSFPPQILDYLCNTCVAPRLGEGLALPPGWLEYLAGDGPLDLAPDATVDHRGGCLVLGSTPPSVLIGEFYEVTRDGSTRHRPYKDRDRRDDDGKLVFPAWRGYSSHSWTLEDVYNLPDSRRLYPALVANWEEALVEKAEKGWSDDNPIWLREYKGQWASDGTATVFRYVPHKDGEPWNEWDPFGETPLEGALALRKAVDALPLGDDGKPMEWFHVVAADQGNRDPFALNIFSFSPQDRGRRIFHTYGFERVGQSYARIIAQHLLGVDESSSTGCCDADKPKGLLGVIGWPVGMVLDSGEDLVLELANVYGLRFKKADRTANYKFAAIELVNGDLVEGFIKIIKGSPLASQLGKLQWKPDDFGNPREDKAQANHSTDCLILARRLISHMFESGTVTQDSKPRERAYIDPMGLDDPKEPEEFEAFADQDFGDLWG